MFSFIWRWLVRPASAGRDVFRYWNGAHIVGADPLKLRAALDGACKEWPQVVEELRSIERTAASGLKLKGGLAESVNKKRDLCHVKLVSATRQAFKLDEFQEVDGRARGLTDIETLNVLADYLVWIGEVMEETAPLASAPPSTDSAAPDSADERKSDSPSTPSASPPSATSDSRSPSATLSPEGPTEKSRSEDAAVPPVPIVPDDWGTASHP